MLQAIPVLVLYRMLQSLSVQELKDIHGFVALDLPWVVIEVAIHAMLIRRLTQQDDSFYDLKCLEFFAGGYKSSQIAKAFGELGLRAYAFVICRILP